jgi:peptidoglycan/xylan/chitin deacetylase (PgdA/CDA1 family)
MLDGTGETVAGSNNSPDQAERFDNGSRLMNLRHSAFAAAFQAIALTGADRWAGGLARGCGAILMLHHVRPWAGHDFAPNRLLEVTPAWLDMALALIRAEGHEIVSMDEMAAHVAAPRAGRFCVALTFDDGYRDNVEHALPVLRRHDAAWTLYVTTGFADGAAQLWWLELEEAVRRLKRITLSIGGAIFDEAATDAAEKQSAFGKLYWALRKRPESELRAAVARLAGEAGIDGAELTRSLCLDWEGLRALATDPAVTIGAHTDTHPMLAKWPIHVAQPEILGSKYRIEQELRREVRHFAYPVGDPGSAGQREFDLAKASGYLTAVTTRPGHVFAEHAGHLHALPRVSLNGFHQNEAALRALLSGLPFLALNRGRKLNVA